MMASRFIGVMLVMDSEETEDCEWSETNLKRAASANGSSDCGTRFPHLDREKSPAILLSARTLAAGALSGAMILALVVNRVIERQITAGHERDVLAEAVERSLGEAERLAKSKSALLSTLSDEVRTGLTGVVHVLAAAAGGVVGAGRPGDDAHQRE